MRTANKGFTLTELMIAIAIVGALLGIAIPNYRSFILKSHRTDARSSLMELASKQERFIAQRNTYTTDIASAAGLNYGFTDSNGVPTSQDGYYMLAVTPGSSGDIISSYLITATAIGTQTKDTACPTLTFDSAAKKGPAACW